jgi:hypothetical protein
VSTSVAIVVSNTTPSQPAFDLTSSKLPPDLTNHKTRKNDEFSSFDSFKDDIPANKRNELASTKLPHDLTNHETKHNNDELNSFVAFKDDIPSNATPCCFENNLGVFQLKSSLIPICYLVVQCPLRL